MSKQTTSKVPQIRFKGFEGEWTEEPLLSRIRGVIDFRGRTPKKLGMDWSPSGYLALSALNVKDGYIDRYADAHYGDEELYTKWMKGNELHCNQVLFTTEAPMGNVAQIPDTKKYILSQRTIAFVTDEERLSEDYLAVLLKSPSVFGELLARSSGGTAKGVSQKSLSSIQVRVSEELTEQAKIGEYFRELDGLIGLHQRKHDKLVTLKKAMLQKMFPQPGATTPEIRFKGFSGEWEHRSLSKLTNKVTEKNVAKVHSETFTNSAELGVISQRDYFDKDISNAENIGGYYIVEPECFVYNPRISALAPVGPVNRNKLGRTGVMSPLYTVFQTKDVDNTFLEYFFKTNLWHPFMFLNGDTGARADRFSIKDAVFMELPVPYPVLPEQQKIGLYFRTLDTQISQHAIQLQKLQQIKSACLEKMFV